MSWRINPAIFRAYDIRGIAGTDLTQDSMQRLGKAVGSYFHRKFPAQKALRLCIGRDNRTHGEALQQACIAGLVSTGIEITNIGPSPSPLLYYSTIAGDFDGGINITASHNPKEYNGLKIVERNAHSVCGEEIQAIRIIAENERFESGSGNEVRHSWEDKYLHMIREKITLKRPLKVVIDAANGIAGMLYPKVLRALGCDVIELYCEQDGTFPNHEPDPIVEEYLSALKQQIAAHNADVGIAFDGDGDRLGIIDNKGVFHDSNELLVLLARDIVSRTGTNVIYTVSCSSIVPEEVEKCGGKAVMVPVGHSYVEEAMRRHSALLGGEQSGHFFIAENYFPFDDACFTACRILEIISRTNNTASEIFAQIPKAYALPEVRPDVPDEIKFEVIKNVTADLQKNYRCDTMDGIRIDFGEGAWASIRASNTAPKLSICIEARSPRSRDEVNAIVWKALEKYGIKVT